MGKTFVFRAAILFWTLFTAQLSLATPEPLGTDSVHTLDDFRGGTFLNFMLKADEGVVPAMDNDWNEINYEFPTWAEVELALEHFDKKNTRRVWNSFNKREVDIKEFVELFQGETFKNSNLVPLIRGKYFSYVTEFHKEKLKTLKEKVATLSDAEDFDERALASAKKKLASLERKVINQKKSVYGLSFFLSMAGEAGTLVIIDENNYFYNVGYQPGEVRSGRSYAASPIHPANDVSHKNYLKDLEEFLTDEEHQDELFYTIVMDILTDTNDSQYADLSDLGQSVATDFVAVYVAELRRHIMKNLHPNRNEWSNDYIEVTLISSYVSESGKIAIKVTDKRGDTRVRVQEEPMWEWWELNPETMRSGIGKTQRERRMLQKYITAYMKKNHPSLLKDVLDITGRRNKTDAFRALAEYLNNYRTPRTLGDEAKELSEAMVAFLMQINADADDITEYIYEKNRWMEPQEGDISWQGR